MFTYLLPQIFFCLGLFKNISGAASTVLKENLLSCEESPQVEKTKKIHQMVTSLKETRPVLSLQWIQLVFLLGFDNEAWWTTLQGYCTTYIV